MNIIEKFRKLAAEVEAKIWPLVGEVEYGPKIPYFGQAIHYRLQTGNGVEDYTSLLRSFGWVVVFGITTEDEVVTLVQWKPGTNLANWELPPGGIGKIPPGTPEPQIRSKTQEFYLRETGFGGGDWTYLGHVMVESGKYRGAGPEDHGLPAHMYLATGLQLTAEKRSPLPNEIIEVLRVPLAEFEKVIDSGLFNECSALPCALLALRHLARRPRAATYAHPSEISDEAIRAAFEKASEIQFSARRFNSLQDRYIAIDGLGWWLPATRVLDAVGFTPQDLREVFSPRTKFVKRHFPFNWSWWGLNRLTMEFVDVELPAEIASWEQLGSMPLEATNFRKLARVLGKSIKVLREDGGTGDHYPVFTVYA